MFEPLRPAASSLEQMSNWPDISDLEFLRSRHSITKLFVAKSGKPIRFVPQDQISREFSRQYEPRIYLAGEVQTRPQNWHDLFNALAWLTFPRAKAALNQTHYHSMLHSNEYGVVGSCRTMRTVCEPPSCLPLNATRNQDLLRELGKTRSQRGPLRDAATLFDESGVVVVSADAGLPELLRNFEWKELFWRRREAVLTHMKFFIFGHGLYEKALNPYVGMTGKALVLDVGQRFFSQSLPAQLVEIDCMLDQHLSGSAAIVLTPLPVLGYPAWSPDNASESYYDDRHYFRPAPSKLENRSA